MVPGFRVAAAAVEAEADLRELSVDDWDSALEEAGDTLVVVDFYTAWYHIPPCISCESIFGSAKGSLGPP